MPTLPRLDYFDWARTLLSHSKAARISPYAELAENGGRYPVYEAVVDGAPWLVITSGFHGTERSGPITLAESLSEMAALARARGIGLRIYPCINPSGFEAGTRYNASGERPNNDLLRYEVAPGVWKDELGLGESFLRWEVHRGGPKETRALRAALEAAPTPVAALDIHQDHELHGQLIYAYSFGDPAPYRQMLARTAEHATVARSFAVDEAHVTDADGLIVAHDGSVTDYFLRRGSRYCATLETTTGLSYERSRAVNLEWVRGFIELAASAR